MLELRKTKYIGCQIILLVVKIYKISKLESGSIVILEIQQMGIYYEI